MVTMADLKQKKVNAKYELLINGLYASKMEETSDNSVEVEQDKACFTKSPWNFY